jgi:hypothetical protein
VVRNTMLAMFVRQICRKFLDFLHSCLSSTLGIYL